MHNAITSVGHYGTDHGSCTSHMILPKVRKHISCTGQGLTQSLHCRTQLNSRANSTPSVTHPAQLTGRQRCMHCGCGQVAPCTSIMDARMGVWQKRVPPHPCHPGRHGAARDPAIAACGCELSSRAGRITSKPQTLLDVPLHAAMYSLHSGKAQLIRCSYATYPRMPHLLLSSEK